jgi:hypothetical protein
MARLARSAALAVAAALSAGWPAGGASAAPVDDVTTRLNFAAADRDGDGFVTEAEVVADLASAFTALDANKDRALDPGELGAPDAATFETIDANRDGRISFAEAADHKLASLSRFASDADGRYSYDEIRRYDASR